MTSSLFATTVFASFFVVALPHILPCPAPRVKYADGEMPDGSGKRRRRRKPEITETPEGNIVEFGTSSEDSLPSSARTKRECPVPKPGGVVGELLGFKKPTDSTNPPSSDPVSR
jgi:cytochrome c oxidase assembly factor 2